MAKAFLIDGTACCYRAFYAIRSLATTDGRPTNAVYGVAMILQALREKERPDYLAVAFDLPKPTFRHQKFEAYKIQRKPMPDPLVGQLPLVRRLLQAYRIPVFAREGYEAEDVLATVAKDIASPAIEVFLVTGDKDLLQLVNSHIKVYNPHHEEPVYDAAAVKARYGIGPERMVDLMALMGDEIDNIPGVRGIGEKTAAKLLQRFGSLEELYRHVEELENPAQQRLLRDSREQVELARELARIDAQVPLEVALEELRVQEPDWRALRSLFRDLQFKKLLQAIDAQDRSGESNSPITSHLAKSDTELGQLVSRFHQAPRVALSCWPVGDGRQREPAHQAPGALVLCAAVEEDEGWLIWLDRQRLASSAGQALAAWLADPSSPKIGHDLKTAKALLRALDCSLQGVAGDTMLAAYLLNPARTEQPLGDVADEHLDVRLGPVPVVDGPLSLESVTIREPLAQAVCTIQQLHASLLAKLQAQGLASLYTDLELPLLEVLAQMEATGIAVDLDYLVGVRTSMEATLSQLTQELYTLAGCTFNLNSPKQLAQVLFDQLKLPVIKRTKTGPSTDSEVLRQLGERHPLPKRLIEYRELSKLVSTYLEALPKLIDPRTGRLHTSFNQTATATGRLSSSDPNLQNIPIKTELGRKIRRAFIPGQPGWQLLAADYSQIELRILAHVSGDAQLRQAFAQGRDIHRSTASLIYGVPEAEVSAQMRSAMKAINFGIIYGMSAHGLSNELGISHDEAAAFITAYFERYPKVRAFFDEQALRAQQDGYVQTLLGRRRYIPEITSPDPAMRQLGQRLAINAPIQGSAADLIKRAMVHIAQALAQQRLQAQMLVQVHDELVFETPPDELQRLATLVKRLMEGAIALEVPLVVTLKTGPNWLELTELSSGS